MKKTTITDPIAAQEFLWLRRDGTEQLIAARIGRPYAIEDDMWACPVELNGVDTQYPDVLGVGSMQALSLAVRLVRMRLGHLLDDSETLLYVQDRTTKWDVASLNTTFGG
jgi:hypothetical protein